MTPSATPLTTGNHQQLQPDNRNQTPTTGTPPGSTPSQNPHGFDHRPSTAGAQTSAPWQPLPFGTPGSQMAGNGLPVPYVTDDAQMLLGELGMPGLQTLQSVDPLAISHQEPTYGFAPMSLFDGSGFNAFAGNPELDTSMNWLHAVAPSTVAAHTAPQMTPDLLQMDTHLLRMDLATLQALNTEVPGALSLPPYSLPFAAQDPTQLGPDATSHQAGTFALNITPPDGETIPLIVPDTPSQPTLPGSRLGVAKNAGLRDLNLQPRQSGSGLQTLLPAPQKATVADSAQMMTGRAKTRALPPRPRNTRASNIQQPSQDQPTQSVDERQEDLKQVDRLLQQLDLPQESQAAPPMPGQEQRNLKQAALIEKVSKMGLSLMGIKRVVP